MTQDHTATPAASRTRSWTAASSATELHRRWLADITTVLTQLEVIDAGTSEHDVLTLVGQPDSRGNLLTDRPALSEAILRGTPEQLTNRLRAAAAATTDAAAAEKAANARANGMALSLSFHHGHTSLHRALGISSASWTVRRQRSLGLQPGDRFLREAPAPAIAARAIAHGITPDPHAAQHLHQAAEELRAARAQWAAARAVRDVLIRHLYPEHHNQPALSRVTGLNPGQLWQVLNPGFRRPTRGTASST